MFFSLHSFHRVNHSHETVTVITNDSLIDLPSTGKGQEREAFRHIRKRSCCECKTKNGLEFSYTYAGDCI